MSLRISLPLEARCDMGDFSKRLNDYVGRLNDYGAKWLGFGCGTFLGRTLCVSALYFPFFLCYTHELP